MNLANTIRAMEQTTEREGPVDNGYKRYIQKSGALYCVRSNNPSDKNFGCYSSMKEAKFRMAQGANIKHDDLDAVSQFGNTGWTYGRQISKDVGYVPKRTLTGFPTAPKGGSRKPNPSMTTRLEAEDWGEPMAGSMGHAHIEPATWFHPPSLSKRDPKNKLRIPTDDPREDNDKFLDVTKRNSPDTKDQRMKMLKRAVPAGSIPARTTLMEPHSAVYLPSQMYARSKKRGKFGRGRMVVAYDRQGTI